MSTDTDTPIAGPDAEVLAHASSAVAAARQAVDQAAAEKAAFMAEHKAKLEALDARLTAAQAKMGATPKAPAAEPSDLGEIREFIARDRAAARLGTLKELGLRTELLSEAQALQLAPAVDPRAPDGRAQYEAFAAAHPQLFKPPVQPDPQLEALRASYAPLVPRLGKVFDAEKLLHSVMRGKEPPKPTEDEAMAALRTDVRAMGAKSGFNADKVLESFGLAGPRK